MHRSLLLEQLRIYSSSIFITPNEKQSAALIANFIEQNMKCFDRSNRGHITSSVWIVNAEKTHVLLTHHKKFNVWVQLGGHNDNELDCKKVALQEAEEESGITGFTFLHEGIFDIDIHPIPGTCAYHYDVRYLLQAPADAAYIVSDESHDLAWVPFDKIHEFTTEASVLRMNNKFLVHARLNI